MESISFEKNIEMRWREEERILMISASAELERDVVFTYKRE